jgi:hypothetical protein
MMMMPKLLRCSEMKKDREELTCSKLLIMRENVGHRKELTSTNVRHFKVLENTHLGSNVNGDK